MSMVVSSSCDIRRPAVLHVAQGMYVVVGAEILVLGSVSTCELSSAAVV